MRKKVLDLALAKLRHAEENPRLEIAQRVRLRKGRKELEKIGKSGNLNRERGRVYRAVLMLSATLLEIASEAPDLTNPTNPIDPAEARRAE